MLAVEENRTEIPPVMKWGPSAIINPAAKNKISKQLEKAELDNLKEKKRLERAMALKAMLEVKKLEKEKQMQEELLNRQLQVEQERQKVLKEEGRI